MSMGLLGSSAPFTAKQSRASASGVNIVDNTETNLTFTHVSGDWQMGSGSTELSLPWAGTYVVTVFCEWDTRPGPGYTRLRLKSGATVLAEDLRDMNAPDGAADLSTQTISQIVPVSVVTALKVWVTHKHGSDIQMKTCAVRAVRVR